MNFGRGATTKDIDITKLEIDDSICDVTFCCVFFAGIQFPRRSNVIQRHATPCNTLNDLWY